MQVIDCKIKDIKPNPSNPRTIRDHKFAKLVKSIQDFPEMLKIRPIVVNDDMIVLGGNMRLKACQEAGLKTIPIIKASELTPDQQREFIIKDNVGFGDWDWSLIANDWDTSLLEEWGLDVPDGFGEETVLEAEEDDFDGELPAEPITVLGDLYEIGDHRLLCGDSTDSDAVARLMNGEKADMVFTDPPYGISLKYIGVMGKNTNGKIINDDLPFDPSFVISIFPTSVHYFFGADYYLEKLPNRKNICVWAKSHSEKENLVFGASFETFWRSHKAKREIWFEKRIGNLPENEHEHPTQKPLSLVLRIITDSETVGNIVDLFIGSGTTMVASHQLKRKCFGMELDCRYVDVIVKRMLKLDPTLEVKLNGKPFVKDEVLI